jgi:pSer/pThr/pTyr-binding forkhead associated (FHA) protein
MVSRRHCRIEWRHGVPVVEDLGSRNGTDVNGKQIDAPHALADGDLLELGGSVYAVHFHQGPPAGPP